MRRRILAMVLGTALVASALSGCGAAGGAAKDGGKVKLTIPYLGITEAEQETIDKNLAEGKVMTGENKMDQKVMAALAEKYPDYEIEYVDWGWSEALDQKQRSLIAAGSTPDLIAGETFIPTYALEGILEPLPQDIVDAVYPSVLQYDADGKAVAVAQQTSTFMLWYNLDLVEQCGYTEEDVIDMTWDEWQAISNDITAQGNGEFWGGGIPTFPHAGGSLRATPFFRMMGTDFATADNVQNLSDPKLQETLQYIREMNYNIPEGIGNGTDENPLWQMFADGQMAFVVNGCYQIDAQMIADYKWGYTNLPVPEEGATGNCLVGAVYFGVPKDAKNKEASFNVLREVVKTENAKEVLCTRACGVKEIVDDPSYWQDIPAINTVMESMKDPQSGLCVFTKNSSTTWDIMNQYVLARTTMTEDPIEDICNEAIAMIEALGE